MGTGLSPAPAAAGRTPSPGSRGAASPSCRPRQQGSAILLALFVVTLATLIVTDLFWRQFVLFRTIENLQADTQARLLLRGAQDWARSILQDQPHPAYDALSDPWAQPLARTRLDQLGETAPLAAQASLEGGIEDAQARFNLRNLIDGAGNINPVQLAVLDKLCTLLAAPAGTAPLIAQAVRQAFQASVNPAATSGTGTAVGPGFNAAVAGIGGYASPYPLSSGARLLPPVFPEDLAAVPGIDPRAAQTLAAYVILLDQAGIPVNFNTAGPELMAASIPELSISDANALAVERDHAYFVSVADIQNRLHGRGGAVPAAGLSTSSQYFIVHGTVRLDNAATRQRALVRRLGTGSKGATQVLWEQEY